MRLVATEYLTLDGVSEEPGRWSGAWFNDEAGQFKFDFAGSGELFHALMRLDLIDVYRFMVHPVVHGRGRRLFTDPGAERTLALTSTRTLKTGIVIDEYVSGAQPPAQR